MRGFLGLVQFYRKFIRNCAKIAAPLYALTKRDCPYVWTQECQIAFESLKHSLATAPVLKYHNLNRSFRLYTDASHKGFGAVLGQMGGNNKVYMIIYAGRALTKAEKNLGITDLEGQALICALKHFDFSVRKSHFEAFVDHQPFVKLLKKII